MASTINAITTGTGGVVTTADASGLLNIQTGGTTAIAIDASQNVVVTGTLSATGGVLGGFGVGQTWQNLTASRVLATTYTNSSGKPIMVSVTGLAATAGNATGIVFTVAGLGVYSDNRFTTNNPFQVAGTTVVPNGATYSVALTENGGTPTLTYWYELR